MVEPVARFRRNETKFFADQVSPDGEVIKGQVSEALEDLASRGRLVVYCGSGVTIDKTGIGWPGLIARVFGPEGDSKSEYPTATEISAMLEYEDPMSVASALMQYSSEPYKGLKPAKLKAHLTVRLQAALYKGSVWSSGRLARNVAAIAINAAGLGLPVTIVTSNYETHVESSLGTQLDRMGKQLGRSPAIVLQIAGSDDSRVIRRSRGAFSGEIEMLYLHGRVPESGTSKGRVVLSEADYALSREATSAALRRCLDVADAGVLIVGASLTDPPLIDALALTTHRDHRYALLPVESTLVVRRQPEDAERLLAHLGRRGKLLQTTILFPDFKSQVAQFCEELQFHFTANTTSQDSNSDTALKQYGSRLDEWWRAWEHSPPAKDPTIMYEVLCKWRELIRDHVRREGSRTKRFEAFRLEVWVRDAPDSDQRRITLWGNSAGPLFDRTTLRHADLELRSGNASVRTFTEGRPRHLGIEELSSEGRVDESHTRWKSFLSVPIYVKLAGVRTTVGVITLSSSLSKDDSAIPLASLEHMEAVIRHMVDAAREILVLEKPNS